MVTFLVWPDMVDITHESGIMTPGWPPNSGEASEITAIPDEQTPLTNEVEQVEGLVCTQ